MKAKEIEWVLRGLPTRDSRPEEKLRNKGRPRLTLRHLNALRKHREAEELEALMQRELVQKMYGDTDEED